MFKLKKMFFLLLNLYLLCFLGLTYAGQEALEIQNLYEASPEILHTMSQSSHPLAISVSNEHIFEVSSSLLKAETWLRTHVLTHFPTVKITTILVGNSISCQNIKKNHNLGMVLPSVKNIYHSLTRWGLEREIKVSPAFESHCFDPSSPLFSDDLAEKVTQPLLHFLHTINSTYSRNVPSKIFMVKLESSHIELLKKFGSLVPNKVNLIITNPKPNNRKLINLEIKNVKPYPVRPIDPFPETSEPPLHSSVGYSIPSNIAKSPHPNFASPPSISPPFSPEQSPFNSPSSSKLPPVNGASSPTTFPPCNPANSLAPFGGGVMEELWCVAKPSVPLETLQEALDYACGNGGADCDEIENPNGNCYYPDSVVAHSSYAFNSYYQKYKRNGGSCSFGGTAMLITSDPSYLNCRFHLS